MTSSQSIGPADSKLPGLPRFRAPAVAKGKNAVSAVLCCGFRGNTEPVRLKILCLSN